MFQKEQELLKKTQEFQDFEEFLQENENYRAKCKTDAERESRLYLSKRKKEFEEEFQRELEQQSTKSMQDLKTQYDQILQNLNENINKAMQELKAKGDDLVAVQARENALEEREKVISRKEQELRKETQKFQDFKEFLQNEERYKAQYKTDAEQELRLYLDERKKVIEEELQKGLEQQTQILIKEPKLKLKEQEIKTREQALDKIEAEKQDEAREYVRGEIESYKGRIEEQEKLIKRWSDEISEVYELKDKLRRCQQEERYKQLESLEKENERLRQDLEKKQEEHNDLELRYEGLTEEENNTLKDLQAENKTLRDNAGDLESTKSELKRLEEDKKRLEREVDILDQEILAKDEKIANLLSQYESTAKQTEGRINSVLDQIERHTHPNLNHEKLEPANEIEYLTHIQTGIANLGIIYPTRLLYAFHTALKSAIYSPLSVLLGVSGTGKSELPKLYAYFGGFNFLAQPVQPTWDSPESMMGYFNMVEDKFDSTEILRFFVQTTYSKDEQKFGLQEGMNLILLDEMNLAHIEQYFAEFLSKLEQKRTGTGVVNIGIKLGTGIFWERPLGDNLLWVGTMNEDESTKALSDKVLDRAFCFNFPKPRKLQGLKLQQENQKNPYTFKYLPKEIWKKWQKERFEGDLERYKELANKINKELTKTGRAIGHRVWQGIEFYMRSHPLVLQYQNEDSRRNLALRFAFEEQVVQKIVPKLRGLEMEDTGTTTLNAIKNLLEYEGLDLGADFENAIKNDYRQFIWNSADYLSNAEWEILLPKNVN
ncbi:restriction endonuclease [Helicobacter suis]|uniref:restriction endonuclease n=1 Tax=Helicobacter suis TaxID=104628 RepID=UPI004039645F